MLDKKYSLSGQNSSDLLDLGSLNRCRLAPQLNQNQNSQTTMTKFQDPFKFLKKNF